MNILSKTAKPIIYIFTAASFLSIAALFVSVAGGLLYSAMKSDIFASFGTVWAPDEKLYGILPMISGSLITAVLAVLFALPFALGLLAFIWIFNNRLSRLVRWLVRFMSGIPTIVYSFCGLFILVPFIRAVGGGSGYNILAVSVVLSLLILPTMVIIADSALYAIMSRPDGLLLTTAALGLDRETSFRRVALYVQRKWLVAAVLLSFSRAVGDTMVALMLSGNTPLFPTRLLDSTRTLSGHISLLSATEISPQIEYTLFLAGFLLFATALAVNLTASIIRRAHDA